MVLQLDPAIVAVLLIAAVAARDVIRDLVEVGDAPEAVRGVVGQADVEEAAVLLGDELVHVAAAGPHEQQIVFVENLFLALFGTDDGVGFQQLIVLVVRELVVLELLVDFVV